MIKKSAGTERKRGFAGIFSNRYFLLFFTFFKISALVLGGGLAMLPVIEDVFVRRTKLMSEKDMLDMVAFTQTVPGIVAVNSAVFVGNRMGGFLGALAAAFGAVLPSFVVIVSIATFFPDISPKNEFLKGAFLGIRACVTGFIAVTGFRLLRKTVTNPVEAAAFLVFLFSALAGVSPVWIILVSIPFGLAYVFVKNARAADSAAGGAK